MVPLPHRTIVWWSPCLIVLLFGGPIASSFYCLVVPLPHRSIAWLSHCLIVLLLLLCNVGVHYSDFIPLNLFPLTTAASVSQSDTAIMVSEDDGSVLVCAEIIDLPAGGLECDVVVGFAFSPGLKAGMFHCSVFNLLK